MIIRFMVMITKVLIRTIMRKIMTMVFPTYEYVFILDISMDDPHGMARQGCFYYLIIIMMIGQTIVIKILHHKISK